MRARSSTGRPPLSRRLDTRSVAPRAERRLHPRQGESQVPITYQGGTTMRKLTLPVVALTAVVLAVALAGPAFGGTHVTGTATSLATAKKALRTAKAAKRLAKRALLAGGTQ